MLQPDATSCFRHHSSMMDVSSRNFGLLIAFLIPGFSGILALESLYPPLRHWLATTSSDGPTIGGFLYLTLASVAVGLVASTVRWAIIDPLMRRGLPKRGWDFARLQQNLNAYEALTENHYRFYQFYANMAVALVAAVAFRRLTLPWSDGLFVDVGFTLLVVLFLAGARDTFRKYYSRLDQILADTGPKDSGRSAPTPTGPPNAGFEQRY
jgi:hypothetical protein